MAGLIGSMALACLAYAGFVAYVTRRIRRERQWRAGSVVICSCGVLSGGVRDPRLSCPMHEPPKAVNP